MGDNRGHVNNTNVTWTDTAANYASNIATVSSVAVAKLVEMTIGMKGIDESSIILDIGTGTGVVVEAITKISPSAQILAVDTSPAMLAIVEAKVLANVTTEVIDANSLTQKLKGRTFSHIFSTFVLQFMGNFASTVKQVHDSVRPGGVAAVAVWGHDLAPTKIWKKACQSIDPSYELPQPLEDPEAPWKISRLARVLENAGFEDIQAAALRLPFRMNPKRFVNIGLRVRVLAQWYTQVLGRVT